MDKKPETMLERNSAVLPGRPALRGLQLSSIVMLAVGALFIALAGRLAWWMLGEIRSQTRQEVADILKLELLETQSSLRAWVKEREDNAALWASLKELRTETKKLLALQREREVLRASPVQEEVRHLLQPTVGEHAFSGFFVVGPDFVNLASTRDEDIGKAGPLAQRKDFWDKVFDGYWVTVVSPLSGGSSADLSGEPNRAVMFMAGPIYDDKESVVAALGFILDPRENLVRIAHAGHVGKKGETYIFDKRGALLVESRFDKYLDKSGLAPPDGSTVELRDPGGDLREGFSPALPRDRQPLTRMARDAVAGKPGIDIDGYRDFRGVLAVGAWTWDAKLDLGLAKEIDADEAFGGFQSTRWLIVSVLSIMLVLFLGFSAVLAMASRRTLKMANAIYRSETKLRNVLDNAVDGMITINRRGIVQSFNHAAENIFHYRADEVVGRTVNMLMPEPYQSEHDGYLTNYLNTGNAKIIGIGREVVAKRKDGSIVPVELAVSEVRFGEDITFLGIVRDITVRKQMETALLAARDKLEIRVEKRTRELVAINEELKNFAYIVSHDLRAPLVNLKGFAGELKAALEAIRPSLDAILPTLDKEARQKVVAALHEDVPEALGFIDSSVNRMDNLIGAVLRLSRMGRRDLDFQAVNVGETLNKILATLAHQIEQRRARVTVNPLPTMVADPIAVEQIFGNILTNAVLYLDPSRPGEIEIGAQPGDHETVFHVRDNGRGIAREDMDKIFEIFRRAGRQDVPGEGMGLAYVKTLVRRHGGRIWCESQLGSGSTFYFSLSKNLEVERPATP